MTVLFVLILISVISLLLLSVGTMSYILSTGNKRKGNKAKRYIWYADIGYSIVFFLLLFYLLLLRGW